MQLQFDCKCSNFHVWKCVENSEHVEICNACWKHIEKSVENYKKACWNFQYVLKTVKKHVEISVCSENCKKAFENFRIQVLKWSVPDAHPDSRVLSILKFSGIFENFESIFYSLKDTLLFKCSEFLILWSFWSLKRSTPDAHWVWNIPERDQQFTHSES